MPTNLKTNSRIMNPKTKTIKTIKVNPTWAATADMLFTIAVRSSNFADRKWARYEIIRMGKILDAYCEEDSNGPAPTPPIVHD